MPRIRFGYFVLLILTSYSVAAQDKIGSEQKRSAVLGDLRITLTAVREATGQDVQHYKLAHPQPGYHTVIVFLKVKNVANYTGCTFLEYWLGVAQGYQYKGASYGI